MKSIGKGKILKNEPFSQGIFDMVIEVPEIAKEAKAGQFVNLYTGQGEMILPRPISICEIDAKEGSLRLLYQIVGKGTEYFTTLTRGDSIQVMGPLGNGFSIDAGCQRTVLIGGGIGAPPLLEIAKRLKGKIQVFLGARTAPILVEDFKALGANVYVATDDGSYGFHGNVMQLIRRIDPKPDAIFSCGPKIMLRAVSDWSEEKNIDAQISMEERMACGIGACVGCTIKIRKKNWAEWENLKVCKDGPVFLSSEVVWDD